MEEAMWWIALAIIFSNLPVAALSAYLARLLFAQSQATGILFSVRARFYASAVLFTLLGIFLACGLGLTNMSFLWFGLFFSAVAGSWGITTAVVFLQLEKTLKNHAAG
jgi:hypothetical protein